MILVTDDVQLDEKDIKYDYIRATGPGGQNINKVSTAVQLRFDITNSTSLNDDTKFRLSKLGGKRVSDDGILVIEARRYRSQEKNRLDAVSRLVSLVKHALIKPKTRKKTRPSVTASAARVDGKKRRGAIKRTRRYSPEDWE